MKTRGAGGSRLGALLWLGRWGRCIVGCSRPEEQRLDRSRAFSDYAFVQRGAAPSVDTEVQETEATGIASPELVRAQVLLSASVTGSRPMALSVPLCKPAHGICLCVVRREQEIAVYDLVTQR